MLRTLCSLAVAGSVVISLCANAAEPIQRQRVGLVLGGGGARGAAHIGVLEVLEKNKVRIDCIAGTSMGALVAGSYAAGLSPKDMREALAAANWRDMFIDSPDYSEQNYRSKKISKRFIPGFEMGVTDKGIELPAGVVSGQKIRMFFNHLVHADVTERNIETLPMPLSIVATDIGNGDRVVFRDGSLTTAMRASMSVPGLLAPVDYKGRKLVDGGLVDNVPIAEVRERCNPDVVIAINVGSPLMKAEDVGSLLTVSAQMVNILTEQNVARSLATLKPTDIYIKPDLDGITAGDFERNAETADRGRKAAEAVVEQLKALSVKDEEYAAWWDQIAIASRQAPLIEDVKIAGLRRVNPGVVERYLRVKPGDPVDNAELYKDMQRIYGDNYYERVEYTMLPIRDKRLLTVTPVEKSWGPDYLRLGVALDTEKTQGSSYLLRTAYHKTWINNLGAEMIAAAEIGSNPTLGIEFYQPLDAQQRFFLDASTGYRRENLGIYQKNNRIAEYHIENTYAALEAGVNVGVLGQIRGGWKQQRRSANLETGAPALPEGSINNSGWLATVDFDQFDRLYFPSRGWKAQLKYFHSVDNDYSRVDGSLTAAYPLGDYVLHGKIARTVGTDGALPVYDPASLGGLFNLSAYTQGQILGGSSTYGSIRAEKIIGRMPLGLNGDLRLGIGLEGGRVENRMTETGLNGWLNSTTVYFGGETPLGPVYLGYGYSTKGSSNVYLTIGTP